MTTSEGSPPNAELTRVIPVAREVGWVGGGGMIVASVEMWASSVVVQYAVSARDTGAIDLTPAGVDTRIFLIDDLNTPYELIGAGPSVGDDQVMHYNAWFAPAVPDAARRLMVTSSAMDEPIEFPL